MKNTLKQVHEQSNLNLKWIFIAFLAVFIFSGDAFSQNNPRKKEVSGIVTDNVGDPLIGVSVVEVGTTNGIVSDLDGYYKLLVPIGSKLQFSYIGYQTQTIVVGEQSVVNITMIEGGLKDLEEVVVVGYGTVKKKDLTGSVASISSEKLLQSPALSATEAIQGKVAGVLVSNSAWTPGATPSILIRGKRSINAGNDPLYVIDGIPVSTAPNMFAVGDIETIDILKDASATAIYGSRGANGVILITTKKGKAGKIQVSYNGSYGLQTIQNRQELMNGAEYAEYVRESYRAAGLYNSSTANIDLDKTLPSFTGDDYTWQSIAMAYDENGNYDPSKVRSGALWWDEVERTGMVTDHQLSVRGGSEKIQFSLGTTYYKNEGIYKQQDYSRYTIDASIDAEVAKWLKVGGQSHFINSLQHRGTAFQNSWRVNPLGRLYDDDGNPTLMTSGTDSQWWNPLQYLETNAVVNPLKINRYTGSYYGEVKFPVDGLRYRANIGIDLHVRQDNTFSSANANAGTLNKASLAYQDTYAYTLENLLFYDKQFKDHSFGATLLQSIQRNRTESLSIAGQDLPSDDLLYNDIASAKDITSYDSNNQVWSLASFMGRLNYNYKSRYYATVSMRYDGSSRLADGHKWVSFPAFALAWRLNEESFMKEFRNLDNLKLRLGYGVTANTAISPYQTKGLLGKKNYNYGDNYVIGYTSSSLPDKTLTWETTRQWNAGLDFSFFHGRLSGVVDLYSQETKDLLLSRQLPVVSGYSSVLTNIGSTANKGLEISLSTVNVQTKDFTWSTDFMYSINKEKIVELYNGKVDDVGNSWFIGEALNVYYDYKKIGIWQNTPEDLAEIAEFNANGHKFEPGMIKLLDVNGDHKITADDDRMVLGQARPKNIFNFSNTLTYKNFDFNIVAYAATGGMLSNTTRINHQSYRNNSVKVDYWTPNNPTNDYPRPNRLYDNIDYESSLYYEKSDFLRIKTITLGYSLPRKLVNSAGLSNCRLYFTAQNPLIFTDFTGIDPEGATTTASGTSRSYAAPSVSSWIFGANISF
jgi:TonB-linked SusC/RagA family outer membrane protein